MTFGDLVLCVVVLAVLFAIEVVVAQVMLAIMPKLGKKIYFIASIVIWVVFMMDALEVGLLDLFEEIAWMDPGEGLYSVLLWIGADVALELSKRWKLKIRFEKR